MTNSDISKQTIQKKVNQIDVTKTCGPKGLPPAFFEKNCSEGSKIPDKVFKNIERLRKLPNSWKMGAVTPIHKKWNSRKVGNCRPLSASLLDIESKTFKQGITIALYNQFTFYLTKHQHTGSFVKHRFVLSNMLSFLKKKIN